MFNLEKKEYSKFSNINLFSNEAVIYHVFRYNLKYIERVNQLLTLSPELKKSTLEEIIEKSNGSLKNNAVEAWNHNFFWNCINYEKELFEMEELKIMSAIKKSFGNLQYFNYEFENTALELFGNGWTWLVYDLANDELKIMNTHMANSPFLEDRNYIPLLACDLWEHAYYLDYRDSKQIYLKKFLENIDWNWVEKCYLDKKIQAMGNKKITESS